MILKQLKIVSLVVILILGLTTNAQIQFEKVTGTPFPGVTRGTVNFADVDGDNDQDVLITGARSYGSIANLYINDGLGNFTIDENTPFSSVSNGSVAFADIDGDDDQDVLISGYGSGSASLYQNDGSGNFTKLQNTPFEGVSQSAIAFADVDSDSDMDLVLTGDNGSQNITRFYKNDGNGNFIEEEDNPFAWVANGSVCFTDVDMDTDKDLILIGENNADIQVSKLYLNDGNGGFIEQTETPFEGVKESSVVFADVDEDNDLDVLIAGISTNGVHITKLYLNDGTGYFTEDINDYFIGIANGSIAFADIEGDNDKDVLITGQNNNDEYIAKMYSNNGNGVFSLIIEVPFDGVNYSAIAFCDTDGDYDQDVIITGLNNDDNKISKLYYNGGNGNYFEVTGAEFMEVGGVVGCSDFDLDGDSDILFVGHSNIYNDVVKLYFNDGFGNFSGVIDTTIVETTTSSIALADIDSDNDSDVIISGKIGNGTPITKLYTNNGDGSFNDIPNIPFVGVYMGATAFSDIDGDFDLDVLISGHLSPEQGTTNLYINDGDGNFIEDINIPFPDLRRSSFEFCDIDNDNDQDIILGGYSDSVEIFNLYKNDGDGNFFEYSNPSFAGVAIRALSFADIDNDTDQDLLITGFLSNEETTKLFLNDGDGLFSESTNNSFINLSMGSVSFSDVDGDNDQDVLITGYDNNSQKRSILYSNDGTGSFIEVFDMPFEEVSGGSVTFFDMDGDNDQDVLITGQNSYFESTSIMYRNISATASIENVEFKNIKIFPNPTTGSFHIEFNENYSNIQVLVSDVLGKIIDQSSFVNYQKMNLHIEGSKGIYFITIISESKKSTFKILKK